MILVGSRALALRAPVLLKRKPKDFDWICTQSEFDDWLSENKENNKTKKVYSEKNKMIVEGDSNCEFEIVSTGTSSELIYDLVKSDKDTYTTSFGSIPSLDMLFTIKSSHKYLKNSPFFWKTALDYHMMKYSGAKVRDEYKHMLKLREEETYTYAHPKLNVTKDKFFNDDEVKYTYDHDDIHRSVALYDRPAYTYYMKDGEQVLCDKEKFFSISENLRIAGVIEEACVLAIERSLVPFPNVWTPKFAWVFALSKVCSSITSGWFREYAYENIFDIYNKYPENYFDKFKLALENGQVKNFTGTRYS
jgi:hypothetical protein